MWAAATPGDEVGGYRIVARLGQGATGAVYRAEDGGGHAVAIKVLHAGPDTDESARRRLAREAATLRRLDHPAVAAVLDVELEGESPFIVTELVDGHSLEDDVALRGPYDPGRLADLAADLADALEAVHAAGVVHRDLKPSNIMVTAHGPVLIDFGIAHGFEDARMTTDGLVMGTPGYLAPEMLTGASPSVATDWWGWAASLAFAATARAPFGVTPVDAVLARAQAGSADLRGVGLLRTSAIAGALRPDPAERWEPDEVVRALRKAADDGDEPGPVAPADLAETVALGAASQWSTQVVTRDPRTAPVNDGRTRAIAADVPPPPPPPAQDALATDLPAADATADGQPTDWLEPVPEQVYESESGYVRPQHASRSGLLFTLALPLVAAAATWPGPTFVALAVLVVLARYVGYAANSLHGRRERRGVGRSDPARVAVVAPWHLVRAAVGSLPSLVVAGCSGLVIVVGAWWVLDRQVLVADTDHPDQNAPWLYGLALAVTMVVVVLLAWFGPATSVTRDGARAGLRHLVPGRRVALVVGLVAVVAAVWLGWVAWDAHPITWWPFPGAPDFS
ncbi:serine/threonine-protein kinase [Luteimicrobium sp. NPDC057192]|uniref:serine/threonine-protein kinase n=1 Tax=Luteimicrobium sp. NPDC057192 TaxID=3346042 RepID=UPI0036319C4B